MSFLHSPEIRNSHSPKRAWNTTISVEVWEKYFFIAPLLKIRFSVPAKRDKTAIFNPKGETLKVGLQTALSSRFTGTEIQILKTAAMKNCMHYSKQNTANATRVTAALARSGSKLHARLQSLRFAPCNVIYYFIAPVLKINKKIFADPQSNKDWCYKGRYTTISVSRSKTASMIS